MDLLNSVKKPSIKGGFLAEKSGGFLLLLTLQKIVWTKIPQMPQKISAKFVYRITKVSKF